MRLQIDKSFTKQNLDGLVQDCNIFSALAMEIRQSSTKPSISYLTLTDELQNVYKEY